MDGRQKKAALGARAAHLQQPIDGADRACGRIGQVQLHVVWQAEPAAQAAQELVEVTALDEWHDRLARRVHAVARADEHELDDA